MIAINITDINNFMNDLLINERFDSFLLSDGEIHTSNSFTIDGRINQKFYSEDELNSMENFISWKDIKNIFFQIIKGKKVPTKLKLVFSCPSSRFENIIQESGALFTEEQIGGLYLHILYENNTITCITGTSLNTFSLDKTLDKYWDEYMYKFLSASYQCKKQ